jgi:sterol desaturase/sphingolipid hydroxylase (fatty acid hydroxylase superfamily)
LDRILRWWWVTPAMHRVHHSTRIEEQQRNYGFQFSVWDRIFGSYAQRSCDAPQSFGVQGVEQARATRLWALLREPFVR